MLTAPSPFSKLSSQSGNVTKLKKRSVVSRCQPLVRGKIQTALSNTSASLHTDRLSVLQFIKIPDGVATEIENKGFTSRINKKNSAGRQISFAQFSGSTSTDKSLWLKTRVCFYPSGWHTKCAIIINIFESPVLGLEGKTLFHSPLFFFLPGQHIGGAQCIYSPGK